MKSLFIRTAKNTCFLVLTLVLTACAGLAPNIKIPKHPPKPIPMRHHPRVALVLGAGGARGYAHIGILQELYRAGVPIDLIVGSSAGSAVAAFYADNQNPWTTKDIMMNARFWDLADLTNFPSLEGAMQGYHFEKFILKHTHARRFKDLHIKLVVVTTDLKTGQPFVIESGPIAPAIEASSAIPGAVKPAHIYGKILVDGGIVCPVPTHVAARYHPDVIIAINIAQELPPGIPSTAYGIYTRAYAVMWQRLSELSENEADIVIRPQVGHVGTFDLDKKDEMFQDGVRAARKLIPEIERLLRRKGITLHPPKRGHR